MAQSVSAALSADDCSRMNTGPNMEVSFWAVHDPVADDWLPILLWCTLTSRCGSARRPVGGLGDTVSLIIRRLGNRLRREHLLRYCDQLPIFLEEALSRR
jgi:hypothetical protein